MHSLVSAILHLYLACGDVWRMDMNEKLDQLETLLPDSDKHIVREAYQSYLANSNNQLFTQNFVTFQTEFLDVLYNHIGSIRYQSNTQSNDIRLNDKISAIDLHVNVDSTNKEGLVRGVNKMHVCYKCISQGRSETDARNISSTYSLPRGDEIGIEKLTCNTCGAKWAN